MNRPIRGPTFVSLTRCFAITVATVALSSPAAAEPAITGRVITPTGVPIEGAHVHLADRSGGITDRDGRFTIAAPLDATLVIEHEGDALGIAVVTGDVLDDIVLDPRDAETIEVHGERPIATPGGGSLDRSELQRVPGVGGDVVRALSVMPGVTNV